MLFVASLQQTAVAAALPANPGLSADELAGPVERSEDADSLAAGNGVEVRSLAIGRRGAWLSATVLHVRAPDTCLFWNNCLFLREGRTRGGHDGVCQAVEAGVIVRPR